MTDVDKLTNIKTDFTEEVIEKGDLNDNFAILNGVQTIDKVLTTEFENRLNENFERISTARDDIKADEIIDEEGYVDPEKLVKVLNKNFRRIKDVGYELVVLDSNFLPRLNENFGLISSVRAEISLPLREEFIKPLNTNFTEIKKKAGLTYIPHPEDGADSPIHVDLLHTGWVKPDNTELRPNVNDPDHPSVLETCEGVIAAQQMVSVDIPAPGSLSVTYTDIVIKPHVEWTPENVKMNMEIARCGVELGEHTDWDKLMPGSDDQTKKLYLLFRAVNAWPTEDIRFDLVLY